MKSKEVVFKFIQVRTNKKDWEDSECMECHDSLWYPNETRYAWVSGTICEQLIVCNDCIDRI